MRRAAAIDRATSACSHEPSCAFTIRATVRKSTSPSSRIQAATSGHHRATLARNSGHRPHDMRDLRARRRSTLRNDLRVQQPSVAQPCAGQQPSIAQRVLETSDAGRSLCAFSRGNRHFTVGGGRLRQSGPRPEARLLRQPALEGLTSSARTDSSRQVGRNKFRRRGGGGVRFEDRWRRLLTLGLGFVIVSSVMKPKSTLSRLNYGLGPAQRAPGPTDEHSVHPHHRDFIITPIADQIGRIDSVSKTEYYDLKNHFSEPQCKMTVLPLNSGNHNLTLVDF
ncbi:hypothetical protein F511_09423 [Dorcoceras hygrometricum]|uniref:Uncharacterized protein n=1 Tax=Dorcoceras hygrometricum TaxID=472368 RepID=A0A2Z7AK61_9LAMI|nr:hypothetical protein F511_09423 [Dorcoceras hygrometricum]